MPLVLLDEAANAFVTFLIEYETFIEIIISWKGKENYCLKVDGNIFSIIFNMYISIVFTGNPLVRAKQILPFPKLFWQLLVFSTNPTTVSNIY